MSQGWKGDRRDLRGLVSTPPDASSTSLRYFGGIVDREQRTMKLREDDNARVDHFIVVLP